MKPLRVRQRFGKYVIQRKLGEGGFAVVYAARDTIEGVRVALKIPHDRILSGEALDDFRREVRLVAQLDHPNILPLKTADYIEDRFVIVSLLGDCTLDERLSRRLSLDKALHFARQMLQGVAYAHQHRIIHCDIKPDNFILFEGDRLRLADFGVARVAYRTLDATGAGTLGYMAPEQAMGRPSFASDVFALGLIFYRMFTGVLPEWPFSWPPPGIEALSRKLHPDMVKLIRRSLELSPRERFSDAEAMLAAMQRIKTPRRAANRDVQRSSGSNHATAHWKLLRQRQFLREFGKTLPCSHECSRCEGPVAEAMGACPWCGKERRQHTGGTSFPQQCPRCARGLKLDWPYCPWCYGPGFEVETSRQYADRRYTARCPNQRCTRRQLMPWMRYCPWCRTKVRRRWKLPGSSKTCKQCGWGLASDYWGYCPWCCSRTGGE